MSTILPFKWPYFLESQGVGESVTVSVATSLLQDEIHLTSCDVEIHASPPSSPADILDGAVLRCVSAWFYVACRRQVDLGFFLQKNHGISLQMASKEAFFHGNLRVPRVPPNANRQLRPYEGSITVTTSPLFRPYGDLPLDFLRSTNSVRCHEEEQSFFFPVQLERYGWFWKYFITPKIRFVVNEKSTRSNPPLK